MAQFKVVEVFELDGVNQEIGTVVELSEEAAASLVSEGKLEAVASSADSGSEGEGESE